MDGGMVLLLSSRGGASCLDCHTAIDCRRCERTMWAFTHHGQWTMDGNDGRSIVQRKIHF